MAATLRVELDPDHRTADACELLGRGLVTVGHGQAELAGAGLSDGFSGEDDCVGVTRRAAADVVFVLIDPGLYHQLVEEQHWKPAAFERWLAETFQMQLLAPLRH